MSEEETESTEEARYRGTAEATDEEKIAVGGEKTLTIINPLFQSDAAAQAMADLLLSRLKDRKKYFTFETGFCAVPLESGDTVLAQERITDTYWDKYPYGDTTKKYGDSSRLYRSNGVVLAYLGVVRDIKLNVTPNAQTLRFTLEV